MKARVRLLNLVVSFTLILLTLGAMLVVLGIFNEALNWDIFGPRLQALLYGVFGACMALAGFGGVMAVIIAMQESVKDFKRFVQARTQEPAVADAPRRAYAVRMLAIVTAMALLVTVCAAVNHRVLKHRCGVFKRLAAEQVANFEPQMIAQLERFSAPPRSDVPRQLYDLVKTIDNLEFVARTTLYLSDPAESNAMWGFTAWRSAYSTADGFAKFYVARDFEKAMRSALDGNGVALAEINGRNEFSWYKVLDAGQGKPGAVVRVDGNSGANFREYRLGM